MGIKNRKIDLSFEYILVNIRIHRILAEGGKGIMEYIHRDLEGKIRELSEDYSFGIIEIRTVMRLIW